MTAEVVSLPRATGTGRLPLVPAKAVLKDGAKLMFDPEWLETRWYRSCSREQAMAGFALRARALKQEPAGSLPDDDFELAHLADFVRDPEGWSAAKSKALEGWILCTDGRWYHPEIARNVLHIWLGRLDSRRVSAFANWSRKKAGPDHGLDSIVDDIDDALTALRALDPQDTYLRKATGLASEWRDRISKARAESAGVGSDQQSANAAAPIRTPNGNPNRNPKEGTPKLSEAKLSETVPFELCSNGARGGISNKEEIDKDREDPPQPIEDKAYPGDAFPRWWEVWPNKVGIGAAERAFAKVRTSGDVGFATLMAQTERYKRWKPVRREWCNPATWLNQRRWLDEWPSEPIRPSWDQPPRNPHLAALDLHTGDHR